MGAVGHLDEMKDAGLAGRVEKAVELIDGGTARRSTPRPWPTSAPMPRRRTLEAARNTRARRTAPLPLCFFNRLHGRAGHRTRWRPPPRQVRRVPPS